MTGQRFIHIPSNSHGAMPASPISPVPTFHDSIDDDEGDTQDRPSARCLSSEEPPSTPLRTTTRTICGLTLAKKHPNHDISSSFRPISPGSTTSTETADSLNSGDGSGNGERWTLETRLARSTERRKRLEGRFQRERSKRRSTEQDRDSILEFVRGLLLGMEDSSEATRGNNISSSNNSTKHSLREFLAHYDGNSYHEEEEEEEKEKAEVPSSSSGHSRSSSHRRESSPNQTFEEFEEQAVLEEGDSSSKSERLRAFFEQHCKPDLDAPSRPQTNEDEDDDYSSDSSYESEMADAFPELPVHFKSLEELTSGEESDYQPTSKASTDASHRLWSDKDLHEWHRDEIQRQAEELENLHRIYEESTRQYYADIDSMERRFQDERLKREDLLERALSYAEELEAKDRQRQKDLLEAQSALEQCAHEHFQTVETLRMRQREDLRQQKKDLTKDLTVKLSEKISRELVVHVKHRHEEELANERYHATETCTLRHSKELRMLEERYKEDLSLRDTVLDESEKSHAEELRVLRERHEQDLMDLRQSHQTELQRLQDQTDPDRSNHKRLLLKKIRERDATIEQLQAEMQSKNEQPKDARAAEYETKIKASKEELAKKDEELRMAQESLHESTHRIRALELEDELRQVAAEEVAAATCAATESTAKIILELQELLRERDVCIEELEEDLERAVQQSVASNPTQAHLEERLQARTSEIAQLRKDHHAKLLAVKQESARNESDQAEEIAKLKKSVEELEYSLREASKDSHHVMRLKKELEEIELHHVQEMHSALQEKDIIIDTIENDHDIAVQKLQDELEDHKKNHAEDVETLVDKINVLHSLIEESHHHQDLTESSSEEDNFVSENTGVVSELGVSELQLSEFQMPAELTTIEEFRRGRLYDIAFAFNQAGYQSKVLEDVLEQKKQDKASKKSKWFGSSSKSNNALRKEPSASSINSATPPTSVCSSSIDDDQSLSTLGSLRSLPPRTSSAELKELLQAHQASSSPLHPRKADLPDIPRAPSPKLVAPQPKAQGSRWSLLGRK